MFYFRKLEKEAQHVPEARSLEMSQGKDAGPSS